MQLLAYFKRSCGCGRWVATPNEGTNHSCNQVSKITKHSKLKQFDKAYSGVPSSYALAATLAAMCAEMSLIFEKDGYIIPLLKFSSVTCPASASAVLCRDRS